MVEQVQYCEWVTVNRILENIIMQPDLFRVFQATNAENDILIKERIDLLGKKRGHNYVIDEENNIAKIELKRRNEESIWTIIDLEDLDRVISFPYTWFAKYNKSIEGYYAVASQYISELGRSRPIHLHQFIMKTTDNNVDHRNHIPTDNRKSNLRVITVEQNSRNRENKNRNNKSGYRNVSWRKNENVWVVQLQINGRNTVIGRFPKEQLEEAGKFAEQKRREIYGEFAGNG